MEEAYTEQMATPPASVSELMTAICNGQLDRVVQLLDSRVATEDASLAGYSAVHYAAVNNRAEILRILTRRGFKVNSKDSLGYTPLHLASAQGHLSAVTVLLEASCSVNSQDHVHGNTAIHEAAWNGFSQTLLTLIKHRADVNLVNKAGFSPLHLSSQNGHNECSRILLFANCKPNQKNNYGDTPLHTAARYGHAGVTRILLIAKCNVNEQNQNGDTGLHIAAALKFKKITKMLLQADCDTNILNSQNERAADIAKRKGHDEILRLVTSSNVGVPSQRPEESFDLSFYKISGLPTVSAVTTETVTEKPTAKEKKQKWSLFSKNKKVKDKTQPEPSVKPSGNPRSPNPQRQTQPQTLMTRPGLGLGQTVGVDPEVVLRSFHLHQMQKHHALKQGTGADPVRSFGDPTYYPVRRMTMNQSAVQSGVQYYRDLAGNIKQGPVGYVPETKQMPRLHRDVPYPPPDVPPLRVPTGGGGQVHYQNDHLSYLRSRNTHLTSGAPQVGQYPYLYEQPGHCHRYWVDSINRDFDPQRNRVPETGMPVRMVRSRSDETISTASSCQHPSVHAEKTRNVRGHNPALKRHRSRTRPVIGQLLRENTEYFASGNPGPEQESFDRHRRLQKSQRSSQAPHLRKKTEKTTSTSSESGANSSGQPLPPEKPLPSSDAARSRIDATSNPDSGYGGSKACLEAVTTSLQQLALSNSSSFHSNEDLLRCNGSENKLTSSTDNTSVVSSAPSGSVVSLCNSL